ncbi:Ribonuclease H [Lachnellula occidentalis]|uniref:ribonuclease H n=1 Tax=Lachnellula occidentalis TaxID=215460 RepID=A0A8H8RLL4_9HELO|nr:Ribonuclease H [Lachnellula occidentalis]
MSSGNARAMQSSYPTLFQPPNAEDTPQSLFSNDHRFIRKSDPRQILIYTDGSCLRNGQDNPQAGYSFVYRPSAYSALGFLTHAGSVSARLETCGPTGQFYIQTSNRAELRAVIAALQWQDWSRDCNGGWRSLVVATDSEYVALNATQRIQRWESEGWTTTGQGQGTDIKNQDLWKLLLTSICNLKAGGMDVFFWRIPRDWNAMADMLAKVGAEMPEIPYFQILKLGAPKGNQSEYYDC